MGLELDEPDFYRGFHLAKLLDDKGEMGIPLRLAPKTPYIAMSSYTHRL